MFRTIWTKSLRDYRVAILAWGIGLGLLMAVALATASPAILANYATLAPLFGFLGSTYAINTPEGYVTFRYLGLVLPLLFSFWPILAGARIVRGEEERGTLDVLLATPQTRVRLLLEKILALALALILVAIIFALGIMAGEANLHHIGFDRALLEGLNLSLFTFFFGMVALLISQFTTSRGAAAGLTSGLMLLTAAFDITGREVKGSWIQYLSPFHYYNLNKPLIPSFHDTPLAALLLVGLCVLCIVPAVLLFARRDIGRAAFTWQWQSTNGKQQTLRSLDRAEHAISTRSISLNALSMQGWTSFWWLSGILVFCGYLLFLTPSLQQPFYNMVKGTSWLQQFLFDTPTNTNAALIGTIIFTFAPPLIVVLALTLSLKWAADIENGRLELVFSTPNSRQKVLLERFAVNIAVTLLATVLLWLLMVIGARLLNIDVDQGRIAAASFNMFPPAFITISVVYALAGRLRYTPLFFLLTMYLILAFLEESLEGNFKIPTWIMSLSIFHLYGNPVFLGMNWGNFLGMMGAAIVLMIVSVVQFRSADIARG